MDLNHARVHARKLAEAGLLEPGTLLIALHSEDWRILDERPDALEWAGDEAGASV